MSTLAVGNGNLDYFRLELPRRVNLYNQQNRVIEMVALAVRMPGLTEYYCSHPEPVYNQKKLGVDWKNAQEAAEWLFEHSDHETILEILEPEDPLIRTGVRAVSVPSVVLAVAGASKPELNEALALALFSGLGLMDRQDVLRRAQHSGSDPYSLIAF